MEADLGDRPSDGLQRLVEPVDVTGRRAGLGTRLDSCFQHVNTVAAQIMHLNWVFEAALMGDLSNLTTQQDSFYAFLNRENKSTMQPLRYRI